MKSDVIIYTRSSFFFNFLQTVRQIRIFFILKPLHPKGNHASKFQLIRFCRFGGVWEQTNNNTDSLTSYCFRRRIECPHYCASFVSRLNISSQSLIKQYKTLNMHHNLTYFTISKHVYLPTYLQKWSI